MRFVKFIFGGGGGYNTFLNSSKELTDKNELSTELSKVSNELSEKKDELSKSLEELYKLETKLNIQKRKILSFFVEN